MQIDLKIFRRKKMKRCRPLLIICILCISVCPRTVSQEHRLIWLRPSAGQALAKRGIDTTDVQQLKAVLNDSTNYLHETVLEFLTDQPKEVLADDIAPLLRHRSRYVQFAAAVALLALSDPRGISFLDSTIRAPFRDDVVDIDRRFRAIYLMANRAVYEYVDNLVNLYSLVARSGYIQQYAYEAVLAYASHPGHRDQVIATIINSYPAAALANRGAVLFLLDEVSSPRGDDYLLSILTSDTSVSLRSSALSSLAKRPTPPFESFVFRVARTEANETMRLRFCNYLRDVGTPSAIWTLSQLLATEQSEFLRFTIDLWVSTFDVKRPPSTTPLTVLLDSLTSYKHQVFEFGWLADKNFAKELNNHLENARKHLVKGDSVNTSKEVEKFQEKVNKEYQKTIDNEKKNKPRDKRFVTTEGYKFLYYNAQYILDRLPSEKKGKGKK